MSLAYDCCELGRDLGKSSLTNIIITYDGVPQYPLNRNDIVVTCTHCHMVLHKVDRGI